MATATGETRVAVVVCYVGSPEATASISLIVVVAVPAPLAAQKVFLFGTTFAWLLLLGALLRTGLTTALLLFGDLRRRDRVA